MTVDVAIIGAGMAGLACAQRLQQLGLQVVVVEKSRGLGGRLATRRLTDTYADHGVRCLEEQGPFTQLLIEILCSKGILSLWTETVYELARSGRLHPSSQIHPRYGSSHGMTAVAKFLGSGLAVWRGQRVQALVPQSDRTWVITLEPNNGEPKRHLVARAVIVTCPAPQALALLEPLAESGLSVEFLAALRSVTFAPCITTIASYAPAQQPDVVALPWQAITFPEDPELDWLAIDSTKQFQPQRPVVIIQSTAALAQSPLQESDLQPIGQQLVSQAAQRLQQPWLTMPTVLQVHRWRYAFVTQPIVHKSLNTLLPLPLGCSGDWCGGATIDAALQSGLDCAEQITDSLTQKPATATASLESIWFTILKQISLNL